MNGPTVRSSELAGLGERVADSRGVRAMRPAMRVTYTRSPRQLFCTGFGSDTRAAMRFGRRTYGTRPSYRNSAPAGILVAELGEPHVHGASNRRFVLELQV
jgi:hypothetical protein